MCSASSSTRNASSDHDALDRLLEELGEAGHVDALLPRVEVDRAVDRRRDELLAAAVADADRLLDARDADAREAERDLRRGGLQIGCLGPLHPARLDPPWPTTATSPGSSRSPATTCARRSRRCTASRRRSRGAATSEPPADRYVEMIDAASAQLAELLDELSLAARIESGRYDPTLREADTLELAQAAAARLGEERVRVTGSGASARDGRGRRRARPRGARSSRRSATAASTSVEVEVDGAEIRLSPVTPASAPVVLGDDLRDLGAAVAVRLVRRLGGSSRRRRDARRSGSPESQPRARAAGAAELVAAAAARLVLLERADDDRVAVGGERARRRRAAASSSPARRSGGRPPAACRRARRGRGARASRPNGRPRKSWSSPHAIDAQRRPRRARRGRA